MRTATGDAPTEPWPEVADLIGRVNQAILDAVQEQLDRHQGGRLPGRTLTASQAMMLYRMPDRGVAASELRQLGCWRGTNVSHTLDKLTAMGALERRRSEVDRRSVCVTLTESGRRAAAAIDGMFARQARRMPQFGGYAPGDLDRLTAELTRLLQFLAAERLVVG